MQASSSSSSSSSSATIDTLFTALVHKGWCLKDIKPLIEDQLSTRGNACTVDSVESELLNFDLQSIGGKSLPESSSLRKSTHYLQGPKILQVSSVRDISRSGTAESSGNSNNHRLLCLKLTDGHSEVTAVEYSPVPSLSDDIVPGTKVHLENKAVMHYGIICLNSKAISVLGGVVQSLYEEWQTNRKYAGFSRSSIRQSNNESTSEGPPAFEKLQVGAKHQQLNQPRKFTPSAGPSLRNFVATSSGKEDSSSSVPTDSLQSHAAAANYSGNNVKLLPSNIVKTEEKPATSEVRPKEVVESIPVQNQAAAQKLLQKMTQPSHGENRSRFRRHRGKEEEEDSQLLTLEEWEKRKAATQFSAAPEVHHLSQDEDLARQLQMQFDLEEVHVQRGNQGSEADNIRMSMFSFERDEDGGRGGSGFRGRGRGRGGRRGRGRGRGRGRNY